VSAPAGAVLATRVTLEFLFDAPIAFEKTRY
jgi:hypothetical protein